MVNVNNGENRIEINVSTPTTSVNAQVSKDLSQHYSQLAKDWAIKTGATVDGEEYSAKHYSQLAKDWAQATNLVAEDVINASLQAQEDINNSKDSAITLIEETKNSAISDINLLEQQIATNIDSGINEINTAKDVAIDNVNSEGEQVIADATEQANRAESAAEEASVSAGEAASVMSNALNKTQITNCILEAPHMVDLEVSSNALTFKSGSNVIYPAGKQAPMLNIGDTYRGGTIVDISWDNKKLFYIVGYNEDKTDSAIYGANTRFAYLTNDGNIRRIITTYSGDTQPSSTANYLWYDTANNIVKYYASGVFSYEGASLPFAVSNDTTEGVGSIKQIFQYVGYIGSTVWAMKGIKGLIPNSRNVDETLNNIEYTTPNVITRTFTSAITNANIGIYTSSNTFTIGGWDYNKEENLLYEPSKASPKSNTLVLGRVQANSNTVTQVVSKYSFQALDRNDTSFIAHQAMPSGKSVALTLGNSDATYTAPADGYVKLTQTASGNNSLGRIQIMTMTSYLTSAGITPNARDNWISIFALVQKGEKFKVSYGGGFTKASLSLSFSYAIGAGSGV